jgi:hypothetical protein
MAREIASEIEGSPDVWRDRADYPVTWTLSKEEGEVQVEVEILEKTRQGLHLGISVSTDGISAWLPVGTDIMI